MGGEGERKERDQRERPEREREKGGEKQTQLCLFLQLGPLVESYKADNPRGS